MNYKDIIRKYSNENEQRFSSWDLAKVINGKGNGVEICFYVCHRDEIDTETIIDLHNFGKGLVKELLAIKGSKLVDKGIFLPNLGEYEVQDDFVEICQEEYKETFGRESSRPLYSFSISIA